MTHGCDYVTARGSSEDCPRASRPQLCVHYAGHLFVTVLAGLPEAASCRFEEGLKDVPAETEVCYVGRTATLLEKCQEA